MTRRLHIIQTVATIAEWSGGPSRAIRDLCEALGRTGARVSLVVGDDPTRDDVLLAPDPALATLTIVPAVRRFGIPWQDLSTAIGALLRPGEATIIHDNGIWTPANIAAAAAARRHRLPLVISPHGMLDAWAMAHHGGRKRIAWALYQRRLLQQAAGLCATAPREAGPIHALFPGKPVALIANGVACPEQLPDRTARDTASARTILYMSRIHPVKNLLALVDAWASLATDPAFAAWTLVIAGPDELGHRAEVAARIKSLGIGSRIRLRGPVPDTEKAAAFADADVFVLPSFTENFGIVVAEALAAGVPAIVSNGAPWASIESAGCGWFTGTDAASLADAMAAAMRLSPAERRAMGARGHAHVRQNFGWERIALQASGYYQWLLNGGPRPEFVHV
jgi:glycosyltransferase involved in cell wall biosynthesis